jgi:hypothetical protein
VFVAVPCFKAVYLQVLKNVEIMNIPNQTPSSSVKLAAGVGILSAPAELSDCMSHVTDLGDVNEVLKQIIVLTDIDVYNTENFRPD